MSTEDPVRPEVPAAGAPERSAPTLDERLAAVPNAPGVYLLKDAHGKVIYVGKAVNLRARVRSYLRGGDERSQVRFLVGKLADFETLVTANEKEALILENNLIKQYRPRYNIRLKDDKSYVSVKVTVQRRVAARPGHAPDRQGRQPLLRPVPQRVGGARHARHDPQDLPAPHLQRPRVPQPQPAVHRVRHQALPRAVRAAGRPRGVRGAPPAGDAAARGPEPRGRGALRAPDGGGGRGRALRGGRAAPRPDPRHREDPGAPAGGRRTGAPTRTSSASIARAAPSRCRCSSCATASWSSNQAYAFDDWELPDDEVLEAVLTQFYQATARDVPDEILLPVADLRRAGACRVPERAARAEGRRSLMPQRGDKLRLVEMAQANARQSFARAPRRRATEGARQVAELQRRLGLRVPPRRIECVDIATFQGGETVGAVVAFVDGRPWKDGYRRFRIRSVEGTDDFASVAEVLRAALPRRAAARPSCPTCSSSTAALGQLGAAQAAARSAGLGELPVDRPRQGARGARSDGARDPAPARARLPAGPEEPGRSCARTRRRSSCSSGCATRRTASRTPITARCAAAPPPLDARRHRRRRARDGGGRCSGTSAACAGCARRRWTSWRTCRASRRRSRSGSSSA